MSGMNHVELLCPECFSIISNIFPATNHNSQNDKYKLLHTAKCCNPKCQRDFYLCKICLEHNTAIGNKFRGGKGGGRIPGLFNCMKNFNTHFRYSYHKEAVAIYQNETENYSNNNDDLFSVNNETVIDTSDKSCELIDECFLKEQCGFDKESTAPKYYCFEAQNPGKGTRFLVAKAFDLHPDDITVEEVEFSLYMAKLLTQLPQSQRPLLAKILHYAANSKDEKYSIFKKTRVPVTEEDFECIYTDGKNAIIPNLPVPVVKTTADGKHAYVGLIDVLANQLAFGASFNCADVSSKCNSSDHGSDNGNVDKKKQQNDDTDHVKCVTETSSAKKVLQHLKEVEDDKDNKVSIVYLLVKEWRDGFDPFNTKASRNQVWVNTYTISPNELETRGRNTHFMSIAGKGTSHDEVEFVSNNDLHTLATSGAFFYDARTKKRIKVKLAKFLTCVDRPERASMFQVGDHNGKFSLFWGYACCADRSLKVNHLPHCYTCRRNNILELANIEKSNMEIKQEPSSEICHVCSSWNVMDQKFLFDVPQGYPTNYDDSLDAPKPPYGRDIIKKNPSRKRKNSMEVTTEDVVTQQHLPTVKLSIPWLKLAVCFAHHNAKSVQTISKKGKQIPYWNKGNFTSYLRSCGLTSNLITKLYESAINGDEHPSAIPNTWLDENAIEKCHFAPMHMLFLGHTKSNYEMTSTWLSKYDLKNAFGREVNIYLEFVDKLRVKYFSAHQLSTSTYGTGVWVSENYLFWARTQKFWFACLPSIHMSKHNNNTGFRLELKMVLRFAVAAQTVMSRIMVTKKLIPEMDCVIKIYMDTMYELDHWIQNASKNMEGMNKKKENQKQIKPTTKEPNYLKSNSLGILDAAKFHKFHGPAKLHWEGGYAGERIIQAVKPLLHIKRENAQWQKITLQRLYQLEMINKLLEQVSKDMYDKDGSISRRHENMLKVYGKMADAVEAVNNNLPLSGVVDIDGKVWIACRPTGAHSRSEIMLLEVKFNDTNGEEVRSVCWMAPIELSSNTKTFSSTQEVVDYTHEFVLLLPLMNTDKNETIECLDENDKNETNGLSDKDKSRKKLFSNKYYAIGHNWTERCSNNKFTSTVLNVSIFDDWLQPLPILMQQPDQNDDDVAVQQHQAELLTPGNSLLGNTEI